MAYENDFGDGLIQFPSDSKAAVAMLDADFRATDAAANSTSGFDPFYWNSLYSTWRAWADPVMSSGDFNPLSPAAFVKQSEIADWRAKLQQQQNVIRAAGGNAVPSTLNSDQDKPFALPGLSSLLWGVGALGLIFVVLPRFVAPKK